MIYRISFISIHAKSLKEINLNKYIDNDFFLG